MSTSLYQELDRVRRNTPAEINARIDAHIDRTVQHYAGADPSDLSRHIEELDREWDIERVLETNAASFSLLGLVMSRIHNPKWLWLSAGVAGFLLQHALQGWCPPLPVLRRLGIRTRSEIDREKYLLKALRGDFQSLPQA
jgi:hypothetical protein